ncbi:response regulator [Kaistella palustris]|uniref:response regulator n=1 Tax=Kaistella palustris TaxID=493376 RepID=UPI0003FB5F5A|nr:response regulator [Kaistella palustris]
MEILVVDDNKDICELIENILLSEGYEVESCCNPLEFGDIIKKSKPQLIITDLLMSGYDGRTLTKEIKKDPATNHIKIMMMSAHPDARKISKNAGVDDFLTKPFEIEDLIGKVDQLMKPEFSGENPVS